MSSNERMKKKQTEEIKKFLKNNPKPHIKDVERLAQEIEVSSERVSAYIRRYNSAKKIKPKTKHVEEIKTIKLTDKYFTQDFIDSLTKYVKKKSEMKEGTFLNEEAILTFGFYF
jgi:cupin superfamily acireductone dioxygenase involved in methionine salvage